jgi:rhodanese-related sulfurtransferase
MNARFPAVVHSGPRDGLRPPDGLGFVTPMRQIDVEHARQWLESEEPPQLVDCRERWEHERVALPGSMLLPLGTIEEQVEQLTPGRPVLVYCHHGVRSISAAVLLERAGFDATSMAGGIDAWSLRINPSLRRY